MTAGMLIAVMGAVVVAPFAWSAVVLLMRRAGARHGPLEDAHEKAFLAMMLAPIAFGVALMAAPRDAVLAVAPPLLDIIEFAAPIAPDAANADIGAALNWPLILAVGLLGLYVAGFVRFAAPVLASHLRLRRWLASSRPHPKLAHVQVSDFAATPVAASRGRVLFPSALLQALTLDEVRLIVDHERRHHARGDILYYALLAWIEALLWFNPFVRAQIRHCRLAAELDCDAAVIAATPQMRRAYAQTLLVVLKHTAGNALPCAPAVFSHRAIGEHRMRILRIMQGASQTRKRILWFATVAALALAAPLGAAQLALAQSAGTVSPPALVGSVSEAPSFTHRPLEGRLSAAFGERRDPFTGETAMHAGVDIAAEAGAPIVAPASGRVLRTVTGHRGYGNMLEVDHGGGFVLRYSQLSAFEVSEGDSVRAGQVIARVGQSGRATGPHLHLEVWRNSVLHDPALVLNLPAAP